jgi:hypothetical protein
MTVDVALIIKNYNGIGIITSFVSAAQELLTCICAMILRGDDDITENGSKQ